MPVCRACKDEVDEMSVSAMQDMMGYKGRR